MKITFVLWDAESDGVAVKHDNQVVWTEHSFDSLDQYLRFHAPTGQDVTVEWEVVEGGNVIESSGDR